MQIRVGEILIAESGQYYRVIEVDQDSISLMRVGGQTVFSCRPDHVQRAFRSSKTPRPQTQHN
ncbi:hypothetical protein C7271_15260 [filamentous cyanobacterium CCP5]|nr:hypothetical protein C7271_15260 [filamentous cyanobacterium CCP5]